MYSGICRSVSCISKKRGGQALIFPVTLPRTQGQSRMTSPTTWLALTLSATLIRPYPTLGPLWAKNRTLRRVRRTAWSAKTSVSSLAPVGYPWACKTSRPLTSFWARLSLVSPLVFPTKRRLGAPATTLICFLLGRRWTQCPIESRYPNHFSVGPIINFDCNWLKYVAITQFWLELVFRRWVR